MSHFDAVLGRVVEDDPVADTASAPPIPPPSTPPPPVAPALPVIPVPTPPVPADPVLTIDKQTVTGPTTVDTSSKPTVTGKIVDAGMVAADKKVTAAEDANRKALELEAKNNLVKAEIAGKDLDLEHARKLKAADDAQNELTALARTRADMEKQAAAQQAAYQAEADRNKRGFFKDQPTANKVLWGISLLFGAGATALGKESNGNKLLDKAMGDWATSSQQRLDFLTKQSEKSGGLLAKFMEEHGPQSQQQLQLRIAAGYASVANDIRKQTDMRKGLLTTEAQAAALAKAADFESKAAEARQKVVDARAQTRTSGGGSTSITSGGVSTTLDSGSTKGKDLAVYGPDGKVIAQAKTPKEAEAANKANSSFGQLDGLLSKVEQSYRENGKYINPFGKTSAERDANKGQAVIAFKNWAALGVLSKDDVKLIEDAIGGGFTGNQAVAKLAEARSAFTKAHQAHLGSLGVPGADVTRAWQGGGAPAPGAGGVRKLVNGKPAMVYPDGTMEAL